jgi:hypothetical protein
MKNKCLAVRPEGLEGGGDFFTSWVMGFPVALLGRNDDRINHRTSTTKSIEST